MEDFLARVCVLRFQNPVGFFEFLISSYEFFIDIHWLDLVR